MRAAIFAFSILTVVSLLAGLAATRPASASGGLACNAGDKAFAFSIEGGVSHGKAGSLFSVAADLRVSHAAVAEHMRHTTFALEHVAQYWLDGRELRLTLYREGGGEEPRGFVRVEVRTGVQGDPESGAYAGRYFVTVLDAEGRGDPGEFRAEGRIECFVE